MASRWDLQIYGPSALGLKCFEFANRGRVYSGALRADARSGAFAVALQSLAESTEESLVTRIGVG